MKLEQFLIGALLHDIGKVIERSKKFELPEDLKSGDQYSHAKFSAFLIRMLRKLDNAYLNSLLNDELERLVLNHHTPKSNEELILQIADWISSSEREEDIGSKDFYNTIPLVSIFSSIGQEGVELVYRLDKLGFNNLMPAKKKEVIVNQYVYGKLLENPSSEYGFLERVKYVDNFDKLLALSEIYFSSVPAQTTGYKSDISLYDHAKTTTAIANAMYIDYSKGLLGGSKLSAIRKYLSERKGDVGKEKLFIVLEGDISGIQNFIFNIPSKKAARSLKGRSVYLNLLTRYSADYIVRETGLTSASILYLGGGNFQILLSISSRDSLERIRRYISSILWEIHNNEVILNIDWIEVSLEEMLSFQNIRDKLREKLAIKKLQKLKELDDTYFKIFYPQDKIIYEGEQCSICGRKGSHSYEEQKLCPLCSSLVELTDSLKDARFLIENRCEKTESRETIFDFFKALGYEISFEKEISPGERIYILNDFDIYRNGRLLDGFILGSFNLPDREFEEIGDASIGDNKLAFLKMDVDNLGKIFFKLSEREREREGASISRIRSLSNRLDLFFSGFLINYLIEKDKKGENLYPVFVGGDDLFIIGSWNKVVELTKEIREKFREYMGNNPLFTISAGLSFFRSDYPVIRASSIVEKELERAKTFVYPGEKEPAKDKISILEEPLQWKEFDVTLKLREYITEEAKNARSIIFKIESMKGFKPLLEMSLYGKVNVPAVWRLSYYLREHQCIAKMLEEIVIDNLFEKKKIRNSRLIFVASRLSEMDTRKIER